MKECCEITLPDAASIIKLHQGHKQATVPFTCRNVLGRSFPGRAELKVLDPEGKEIATPPWLTVPEKHEFGKEAILKMEVTAAPPPEAFASDLKLSFKLRVYNDLAPNEEFSETRAIPLEIAKATATKGRTPWLAIAIAAGVVVIGAGVTFALTRPDATCAKDSECAANQVCGKDATCLLAEGQACKQPAECGSGACSDKGLCASLTATTGSPCGINFACPALQTCDRAVNQCRGDVGFKGCTDDAQCATGSCLEGVCDHRQPGAPCGKQESGPELKCPQNQRCAETVQVVKSPAGSTQVTRMTCLLLPQQRCAEDDQCTSQFCNQGKCNRDDMKCDAESECFPGFKCVNKQCVIPLGSACLPSEAANMLCEGGLCSLRTKTCMQSDCGAACGPGTKCVDTQCVADPVVVATPGRPLDLKFLQLRAASIENASALSHHQRFQPLVAPKLR